MANRHSRRVFKEDRDQGVYLVRYVEGDIRDLLEKAAIASRLDMNCLNKGIKKELSFAQ